MYNSATQKYHRIHITNVSSLHLQLNLIKDLYTVNRKKEPTLFLSVTL